tara:strand:+ start:2028 stop:2624 length:597 start_codon:yes stop_codon:yes gene_type:complete
MKKNKSFDTFLEGNKVDLIVLDSKVVKNTDWYTWLNYQKNTELLETGKFPNTIEKQLKYLKTEIISKKELLSNSKTDKKIQLGIVDKHTNILVGMVSAYNFNYFTRTCYVSVIMDLKKKLKNRLETFKEAQDLIIDHIFFKMNFRKIYSGTSSEKLSILTEKLWGFKREGVLKEHEFINGKYVDSYLIGLFRKDWKRK